MRVNQANFIEAGLNAIAEDVVGRLAVIRRVKEGSAVTVVNIVADELFEKLRFALSGSS